jgi:hypothetical protein
VRLAAAAFTAGFTALAFVGWFFPGCFLSALAFAGLAFDALAEFGSLRAIGALRGKSRSHHFTRSPVDAQPAGGDQAAVRLWAL